jgi:hypothetical protein
MQHIPKAISITCHEQGTVTNDLYDFCCKVCITLSCKWANASASIRHSSALFTRVVPQLQNLLLASVVAFMHAWCKSCCYVLLSIRVDRELQHHTSLLCLWFLICMCNHARLYSAESTIIHRIICVELKRRLVPFPLHEDLYVHMCSHMMLSGTACVYSAVRSTTIEGLNARIASILRCMRKLCCEQFMARTKII